jgi:hypothetical protein
MKKVPTIFFFIILVLSILPFSARAEQLSLRFGSSEIHGEKLSTNLSLIGDVSYDTIDAVRNGITAKFFITIQLSTSPRFLGRSRTSFMETVESFNISYDVWESSYVLKDNSRKTSYAAGNAGEIVKTINAAVSPKDFNISAIDMNDRLYVRAKIKIQTIRLFPPFGIFLLFFDPWNFESDWVQVEVVQ